MVLFEFVKTTAPLRYILNVQFGTSSNSGYIRVFTTIQYPILYWTKLLNISIHNTNTVPNLNPK